MPTFEDGGIAGPSWQATKCWFDNVPGARCGWLHPRIQNAARDTALPVVILPRSPLRPSDTVTLFLAGGPGGASYLFSEGMDGWKEWRDRIGLDHDLVLFDARGTGYAHPDLFCESYADNTRRAWGESWLDREDVAQHWRDYERTVLRCLDKVPAADRAARVYSTRTNASDVLDLVEELRESLGYRDVALYGVSYGSRLAAAAAQADKQGSINRIVLDSWYPAGADLVSRTPRTWNEVLTDFAFFCAQAGRCQGNGLDLRESIRKLLAGPARELGVVRVDLGEAWGDEREVPVAISTMSLPGLLMEALWANVHVDTLPQRIEEALRGEWSQAWHEILEASVWGSLDETFSPSVLSLTECADSGEQDPRLFATEISQLPEFASIFADIEESEGFCSRIGVSPAPLEPTRVDVPALVVSMLLDPVTPWRVAHSAMPQLSRGRFHLIAGAGHGVADADECAAREIGAWLNQFKADGFADCDLLDPTLLRRDGEYPGRADAATASRSARSTEPEAR